MKPINAKRERGAALLALLAVIMLGASWLLVSQLNAESGMASAVRKARNAEVLNRAKQALIGDIAMQAAEAGENNPGRLACPEAGGNIGGTNEGVAAGNCTLPAIGRFPWRTFGMDTLVDATSEPLWYVVSPGWALSNSTTPPLTTYINSNSNGQLLVNARSVSTLSRTAGLATAVSTAHGFRTGDIVKIAGAAPAGYNVAASVTVINANTFTYAVDSALSTPAAGSIKAGDAVVALIIAPGPAMNVAASADCAARNQARSVPAPTINALDYLECYDAANGVFSTTGPAASFNNQVVRITVADIMPAIEAAIAKRIERDVVPVLNTVYTPTTWGFSGSKLVYPFAAPFANPGPGIGTSSFQGAAGTYQGLLPFNQTQDCTAGAGNPRCLPSLLSFAALPDAFKTAGSGSMSYEACIFEPSISAAGCTIQISNGTATIAMTAVINNVAMGLRSLSLAGTELWQYSPALGIYQLCGACSAVISGQSLSATLSSSGAATMRVQANLTVPNPGSIYFYIRLYLKAAGDHPLLDASTTGPGATGWFVRNEWYRLLYYATVAGHTATTLPPSCTTMSTCLSVANGDPTRPITPVGGQRAILILAGRSINGSARPSPTLSDYLEFGNTKGSFERQTVTPATAAPYADTGTANAYVVPVASLAAGTTLQFRAANSNTGISTLTTPATGAKSLVNLDGSNLAASTIRANAVVQVVYDGTQFLLSKRPFNDRIVIIGSN